MCAQEIKKSIEILSRCEQITDLLALGTFQNIPQEENISSCQKMQVE